MFDGLGYVITIGIIGLIALAMSYSYSISSTVENIESERGSTDKDNDSIEKNKIEEEAVKKNESDILDIANSTTINNRKKILRHKLLVNAIILIPIINFIYYYIIGIKSSESEMFFIIITFFIFSMPSIFTNILKLNEPKHLFISFLISFILYNSIYFHEKLDLDYKNKIHSFITNGNIVSLEKEFGEDCHTNKDKLDNYLSYILFWSQAPNVSVEFIFDCHLKNKNIDINNLNNSKYNLKHIILKIMNSSLEVNGNFEVLFAKKYFDLFDDESKREILMSIVFYFLQSYNEKSISIYKNRLEKLISLRPDVVSFINIHDSKYQDVIEYRNLKVASFLLKHAPSGDSKVQLAMNVLTNNLSFLTSEIKKDKHILDNTTIVGMDTYFFNDHDINLTYYAFHVSNSEVVNYLIDNQLFNINDYHHEIKATDSNDRACSNDLINGTVKNESLDIYEKKKIILKLQKISTFCKKEIDLELDKINDIINKS